MIWLTQTSIWVFREPQGQICVFDVYLPVSKTGSQSEFGHQCGCLFEWNITKQILIWVFLSSDVRWVVPPTEKLCQDRIKLQSGNIKPKSMFMNLRSGIRFYRYTVFWNWNKLISDLREKVPQGSPGNLFGEFWESQRKSDSQRSFKTHIDQCSQRIYSSYIKRIHRIHLFESGKLFPSPSELLYQLIGALITPETIKIHSKNRVFRVFQSQIGVLSQKVVFWQKMMQIV